MLVIRREIISLLIFNIFLKLSNCTLIVTLQRILTDNEFLSTSISTLLSEIRSHVQFIHWFTFSKIMASTASFVIVSRNDVPIYDAELGSAFKVCIVSLQFVMTRYATSLRFGNLQIFSLFAIGNWKNLFNCLIQSFNHISPSEKFSCWPLFILT